MPTPHTATPLPRGPNLPPVGAPRSSDPRLTAVPRTQALPAGAAPRPDRLARPYIRWCKPVIDRIGALVGLLLLAPLMAAVAVAVYVSMGGPVMFSQTRIGRDGVPFTAWKFRTMHPDRRRERRAHDGPERRFVHKSASDPRLTPTGRLLRKTSLDELPQLLNVLRGEMSLVGPRPELPEVVERHYSPWHHRRHAIKPGLTGLWQVTARGAGLMHEHVDVDLAYLARVGLRTDLGILLRTIPAVLRTQQGQ